MTDSALPNPDWYPDPTGRFEQRYWDGSQWTEHVSSAGQQRTDPLPGAPGQPAMDAGFTPGAGGTADTGVTADLPGLGDAVPAATPEAAGPPPGDPEPVPAASSEPVADQPPPDWYDDPTGRYEMRYWDGSRWTEHVTAAGQQGVDPLPEEDTPLQAQTSAEPEPEPPTAEPEPAAEPPAATNPFASESVVTGGEAGAPAAGGLGPVPGIDPPGATGPVAIPTADAPPPAAAEDAGSSTTGVAAGSETPAAQPAAIPGPPADWYPDPTGRQELRYWDGSQWTEHASTAGQQVVDPVA